MGKPAARVGDMHMCPMVTPGTPPIPHVGGPILPPGVPTVLIGGQPAATLGSMATCTGPPDSVILGSMGVMIGGQPAARMGDMCAHGGMIAAGMPTVLIGEIMPGAPPVVVAAPNVAVPAQTGVMKAAAQRGAPFCQVCQQAAQQAAQQAQQKKTFLDIELKDENGKPVPAARYRVELPDGSTREGILDMNGKARVDGIDPGNCKVTFPEYGKLDRK